MTGIATPPHTARDLLTRAAFTGASRVGGAAHALFCSVYFGIKHRAADPWQYSSSDYEREKRERVLSALRDGPPASALEVGCSEGIFTAELARVSRFRSVVGVDISRAALRRARARCRDLAHVRFEHGDAFRSLPPGPFDVVVCAELLYYAGVRTLDLARLAAAAIAPGGRLLLVHPWPEARQLHSPFLSGAAFALVREDVHQHDVRPYALTIMERTS